MSGAYASRALWAVALLYLAGSMTDVLLLWVIQRIPGNPLWEFAALTSTIEGIPRMALAAAFAWVALHIRGRPSLLWYRVFGVLLVLIGLAGPVIAALQVSDYFIIRASIETPFDLRIAQSTIIKTVSLGAVHLFLFVPVGVMAIRRPRV
jgi:hypothetical protein